MVRDIVVIDEDLCNGCGECVPGCHEGALQIIDGKARLISDLMCDGLGACLGHCPVGAITIEKREARPYDEVEVMKDIVSKGTNTVIAHLVHLKEHNELEFFKQGVLWLKDNEATLPFKLHEVTSAVHKATQKEESGCGGGCPGSREVSIKKPVFEATTENQPAQKSALQQWPVQLHLLNPQASYFKNADVLIAADCVAFSLGDFHQTWLQGKTLAIACPKLDSNQESYINKITAMIDEAKINTITVMMMEVPCCGGLLQLVQRASAQATRKVPVKAIVVSIEGEIINERWV